MEEAKSMQIIGFIGLQWPDKLKIIIAQYTPLKLAGCQKIFKFSNVG